MFEWNRSCRVGYDTSVKLFFMLRVDNERAGWPGGDGDNPWAEINVKVVGAVMILVGVLFVVEA